MAGDKAQSEPTPPTELDQLRAHIGRHFKEWAASQSAKRKPLPDQTGDGTYLVPDAPSTLQKLEGALNDFSSLGIKDWGTLAEVFKKSKTGAPWDDSKYLMEKLVAVCSARHAIESWVLTSSRRLLSFRIIHSLAKRLLMAS
jgi:hypothetical protein